MRRGFWWGNVREGDHLEDPGVDGRIILRWILKKWDQGACTGLIWLRIYSQDRGYIVAAILSLLFMVPLFPALVGSFVLLR